LATKTKGCGQCGGCVKWLRLLRRVESVLPVAIDNISISLQDAFHTSLARWKLEVETAPSWIISCYSIVIKFLLSLQLSLSASFYQIMLILSIIMTGT